MAPAGMPSNLPRIVAVLAALAVAVAGWHLLWFLCDDAYIVFRYAHNLHVGRGPVWNPAPFLPVEGYTSPLWLWLLWVTWAVTGFEPPATANWLSLGCGLVTLCWIAAALGRAALPERLQHGRTAMTFACLLAVAGNRTFCTWLSSGLETALFELWFVGWVLTAMQTAGPLGRRRLAGLAACAALAALSRPEGLLCVGATAAWSALAAARRPALLRGLWPLLAVAAHVLWRRAFYGEWLPNTYYAKSVGAWPEAGWRYGASFVVEQGLWVWLAAAAACAVVAVRRRAAPAPGALAGLAVAGMLAGYYVLYMGGDHFEYRPLVPLVPLAAASLPAVAAGIGLRPGGVLLLQGLLLLAGVFGWFHHASTCDDAPGGFRALAPGAPAILRPVVREYDRWQAWLRLRAICMPQSSHRQLTEFLLATLPPRQADPRGFASLPMLRAAAVGVVGWNLPDIAVLDEHGLNDWVIARNPVAYGPELAIPAAALDTAFRERDRDQGGTLDEAELAAALVHFQPAYGQDADAKQNVVEAALALLDRDGDRRLDRGEFERIATVFAVSRRIAHERKPPPGYYEALRPNVELLYRKVLRTERKPPLLPEHLRAIEREWRARMQAW
jgi:arabinofuranosyltransferase